jgi:predicted solute-binding protein
VVIDYSLAKTWGRGSQFSKIFAVLAHLDWKSFDPERFAAAICPVVNVKRHDLESAQRLSFVAEQLGMKTDMRIGGGRCWKRERAT